jgi:hypothetical protein
MGGGDLIEDLHMIAVLSLRWMDVFTMAMLFVVISLPLFFVILGLRNHYLDDPDCSKFEVFTTDPEEHKAMPVSCQPRYLNRRSRWNSINTTWIAVIFGIAVIYTAILVIVFWVSRYSPALHTASPI